MPYCLNLTANKNDFFPNNKRVGSVFFRAGLVSDLKLRRQIFNGLLQGG